MLLLLSLLKGAEGLLGSRVAPSAAAIRQLAEPAALSAAAKLAWTPLMLPSPLADGPVEASFISTGVSARASVPPIVLLHSFDSSCLEWRRVLPLLEADGLEAYAVCILGWGFADSENVRTVSVEAKRAHLNAFCEQYLSGRPAAFVGSSLGAATIVDFVANHPTAVDSVVCLDPQVLIEGTPPVPSFAARGGVRLLRSWPLRSLGQKVAYEDRGKCDTDDAIRVGRLHCTRAGWEEDAIEWLDGGGYKVTRQLPQLAGCRCLLLWGREDRVLPPQDNVPQLVAALPDATFRWVERCGHVPHLEQPAVTARAIAAFVRGEVVDGDDDVSSLLQRGGGGDPLRALNEFLDRPLLDTNVPGGPLEPFKSFARTEPEAAQVVASVVAVGFFVVLARLLVAVASVVSG